MSDDEDYEEGVEEGEEVEQPAEDAEPEEADEEPEPEPEPEENYSRSSYSSEEEESDDQYENHWAVEEKPKPRPPPPRPIPSADDGDTMTEAEKAMLAAKKKHEEEQEAKMKNYEEERALERERVEEELRQLKEKQERRKQEREEEEQRFAEAKREEEERRRADEEERKRKLEEAKRKKDEDKQKRLQMMAGTFGGITGGPGGRNFTVERKKSGVLPAKEEEGPGVSKEQHAENKKQYMAKFTENFSGMTIEDLKKRIKQMHKKLATLEATNYDASSRHERQEYDLRELKERATQKTRNELIAKGVDPTEAAAVNKPPKVATASKYDRQVDRRAYGDRRDLYQNPKRPPTKKIFHGSARPPPEWGRPAATNDELEMLRKSLDMPKYVEQEKVEDARPPMAPIPVVMPEPDPDPEPVAAEEE